MSQSSQKEQVTPQPSRLPADQTLVIHQTSNDLHHDLAVHTEAFVNEIAGPSIAKSTVVDQLLDIRNLAQGRDLGLELTVDEMLETMPGGRLVSSEWWLSCLSELADHAAFLAAGYPAVMPQLITA